MQPETANNSTTWRRSQAGRISAGLWLEPRLLLVILLALLAGLLAYQARPSATIAIGWFGDQLFLPTSQGQSGSDVQAGRWYGDEVTADSPSSRSRWTRKNAVIFLPGLGAGGDITLTLHAQGWPEDVEMAEGGARQPTVWVEANGQIVDSFVPSPQWQDHQVTIPAAVLSGGNLQLTLSSSETFVSTRSYNTDIRPKGIRVALVSVRGAERDTFIAPPLIPLGALILSGMLCFLALRTITRRQDAAFVLATLLVSGGAVGLTLARVWTAALLPWLALALACVVVLAKWHSVYVIAARFVDHYTRSSALSYGFVGALVCFLLYALVRGVGALRDVLQLQDMARSGPDAWLLALAIIGVVLLALLTPERLAGVASALVRGLASRRVAISLLALFLVIWLGYEASIIATMPGVGHADYADNAVVARNLMRGRGWVVDYVTQFYRLNLNGVTRPQETWPLLQPVWIAPFFALFGPSDWAARIPNIIFTCALGLLVYAFGARFWDRRVGLTAAVFLLTSYLFVLLVLYATSDLAFVIFSFGAISLVYRWMMRTPTNARPSFGWKHALGAGVLTGLMMLQKPGNGVFMAAGIGLWILAQLWRRSSEADPPTLRHRIQLFLRALGPAFTWGAVAALLLAPYVARNLSLAMRDPNPIFGSLVYSTESRDAWVLEYASQWDDIYKIYTPEYGLSETQGLPDRSWILRWGFDRTLAKMSSQIAWLRDYLAPPWFGLPDGWSSTFSGSKDGPNWMLPDRKDERLLFGMGAWLSFLGLLAAIRTKRHLLSLLLLAFVPYTLFLVVYWHANEQRYFVALMPWLALLAAAGLWQVYDRVATIARGRWSSLALIAVTAAALAVVLPSWPKIDAKLKEPQVTAGDREAYAWIRQNTRPGEVAMTRIPWQYNWHTDRPALMIPYTEDAERFFQIARFYNTRYLMFEVAHRPKNQRFLERLVEEYGFTKLQEFENGTYRTEIFAFPEDYGNVAELGS